MHPISASSSVSSMGAPLNEGVVRFGAAQEGRESQRRDRAADVERQETQANVDRTVISDPEACAPEDGGPDDAASAPSTGGGGPVQGHRSGPSRESGDGGAMARRSPAEDGSENQREMALAQHAAEQHGKREQGRVEGDRAVRSTREMMGRVESAGGSGEAHENAPKEGSSPAQGGRSSEGAGGARSAHGSGHGGSQGAGEASHGGGGAAPASRGGGAPAPAPRSGGGGGPRIGGDVLAAVVAGGLTSIDDVAPGAVDDGDPTDIDAEQVDSSQQALQARLEDHELKTHKSGSLGAGLHFGGDGERGRSFDESPTRGGGFSDFRRPPGEGASEEAPSEKEREATGGAGADTPDGRRDERGQEVAGGPEERHAEVPVESTSSQEPGPDHRAVSADRSREEPSEASPAVASGAPAAEARPAAPAGIDGHPGGAPSHPERASAPTTAPPEPASPDRMERAGAPPSLGIDWMADADYLFFDDARRLPEASSGPAA